MGKDPQSVLLCYFSGTGNTKYAADRIAEELVRLGHSVRLFNICVEPPDSLNPVDYDIVGFGFPVHAFNPPHAMFPFVRNLPQGQGRAAFLFKTSGEPFALTRNAGASLLCLLRQKGYAVRLDQHFLMPYNILFRYRKELVKQMLLHTDALARLTARRIVSAEGNGRLPTRPLLWPLMYLFRIEWIGARLNGPFFHARKNRCVKCAKCVSSCPSGNVRMRKGVPSFGAKCSMCMGCVMICPTDAIRPGILTPVRVNGMYPFAQIKKDPSISAQAITEDTRGYFGLFRRYYRETKRELDSYPDYTDKE